MSANRAIAVPAILAPTLALVGCWTAPLASVKPPGAARLIQGAVAVESVKDPAIVVSMDASTRTVVVLDPERSTRIVYLAGPKVSNLDRIKVGDKVRARVVEELTVFVSKDGQLPAGNGEGEAIQGDAKVLMVDPSYRLLTLEYQDGRHETFKVGLDIQLRRMEAGDDVAIRTVEAVALQVQTP